MTSGLVCKSCGTVADPRHDGVSGLCQRCGVPLPWPPAPPLLRRLPAFWVRLALVIAILGSLAVTLTIVFWVGMDWQSHTSDDGGFRADFPGGPDPDFDNPLHRGNPFPGGPSKVVGTRYRDTRREFAVVYVDIPPRGKRVNDHVVLGMFEKQIRDRPGDWKVTFEETIVVSHYPGREVVYESADNTVAVTRFVVAETRAFMAVAAGPGVERDDRDVRQFLDSFEVTGRHLKEIREKEAEEARRREERRQAEEAEASRRDAEIARVRADREKRDAEEAQARLAALEVTIARAKAFQTAPNPRGPVPSAIADYRPVFYVTFDESLPDGRFFGHRSTPGGADMTRDATIGPGVVGKAVYLPPVSTEAREWGPWVYPERLPRAVTALNELTLAGWVKVRGASVELFRVEGNSGGLPAINLGLTGERVWGRIATKTGPANVGPDGTAGQVSAPWKADEAWHHLALTLERKDERRRLKLYFDGRGVAEGDFDPDPPAPGMLRHYGAKVGRATAIPGGGDPEDSVRMKLPVVALDELCVFDWPLSAATVRRLAGVADAPPEP